MRAEEVFELPVYDLIIYAFVDIAITDPANYGPRGFQLLNNACISLCTNAMEFLTYGFNGRFDLIHNVVIQEHEFFWVKYPSNNMQVWFRSQERINQHVLNRSCYQERQGLRITMLESLIPAL